MTPLQLPDAWHNPPSEFSLVPFWFWNDRLENAELLRQLDEFQAHHVSAFVIHPRVGLPRDMGWMSDKLLDKMRFVIEEAQRRGMWVILYDEGMYPSGSSSGQVVAENPAFQCRGLVRVNLDTVQPDSMEQGIQFDTQGQPALTDMQSLIATVPYQGSTYAIVQRPINAVIRGLHYINEDSDEPPEDTPPAIDLLNPEAVACFIRLVYQRYYDEFHDYFGETIRAIFTDEPMLLGRLQETDAIIPGTVDILTHVNDFLGYDFTPYLPALWDEDAPEHIRQDYERAIEHRLETCYYAQIHDWCEAHQIALTGHPAEPDATRHLRYFDIPGQDIVWRFIEPDRPSALEGRQSTQGKAAASMMLHTGKRRNANEFCGAYGHDLTYEEMCWLANWLLIRGCNLLIPHAFYYSVRGARYHERPPDVGLHRPWWGAEFRRFSDACRRLCWLNTDSMHVCDVAILGEHHRLPWRATKICFQHQIDFNYLDVDDIQNAIITDGQLQIAGHVYRVLIMDGELSNHAQVKVKTLDDYVPVIHWSDDAEQSLTELCSHLQGTIFHDVLADGLRIRHVKKHGMDWYMLFNETQTPIDCVLPVGKATLLNPYHDTVVECDGQVSLQGHEIAVLLMKGKDDA